MCKEEIKSLIEEHLNTLINEAKDSTRSGEELKAITEAIEIALKLLAS